MDQKEKSEALFDELQKLESTFPEIEAAEMAVLDDPENRDLFVRSQLAAHLFLNDPRTKALDASIEELKRAVARPRVAYNENHRRLVGELSIVTGPVIERGKKLLNGELRDLPPLDEQKVDEHGGGFSMVPSVILSTNRTGLLEVHKLVKEGLDTLQKMSLRPIFEIETFIENQVGKIRGVDLSSRRETVPMNDYLRQQFIGKGLEL